MVVLNISMVFSLLLLVSIKSYCRKPAGDLLWTEMTLATESRIVFFQNRRLSFFSLWLIMERSHNWPNLGSRVYKFRDIYFIATGTDINRWKFQGYRAFGVAMMSIQFFFLRWGHLTWPGDLGLKFLQQVRHCAPPFFRYSQKNWGRRKNTLQHGACWKCFMTVSRMYFIAM